MFNAKKNLCLAALAALTLNLGSSAIASCYSEISESRVKLNDRFSAGGLIYPAVTIGGPISTFAGPVAGAAIPLSSTGAKLIFTKIDNENELNKKQEYAYAVLGQANKNEVGPELASFIKLVEREVAKDSRAIIPTEEEVIDALKSVDSDLSACMSDEGELKKPVKDDLLNAVISHLNF